MINNYKEVSCKWVDGDFYGRIYEFKYGATVRHDIFKDIKEFKKALGETEWPKENAIEIL
jgi:hypothetical protein